ncbi:MAG: recombinase family protein [Lachnospirales bacterium]
MARKSRQNSVVVADKTETVFNTALYVRLSVLDGNKNNNDSIENQEELLKNYIKGKDEFNLFSVYVDNGESGVSFDRPEFDRLITDVKNKKVNCIIVKDLSRFGRNYIETGEYLEKIFPFLKVRFIAVTDNYDNQAKNSLDDLSMHLLNLTNDVYAKDISRKIGTVLEEKQKKGEFIGAFAPFGYRKDENNNNRLVVDKKVTFVIETIFRLREEKNTYSKIVKWLVDNKITTPKTYRSTNEVYSNNCKWNDRTVKSILENQVYIGDMVQGKIKQSLFNGEKKRNVSEENWIVVRGTHEGIIDESLFYKVQSINKETNKIYKEKLGKYNHLEDSEDIFKGLIHCGNCNKVLKRYRNVNEGKGNTYSVKYFYICQNHAKDINSCSFISIEEDVLKKTILEAIKEEIVLSDNINIFLKYMNFNKRNNSEMDKLVGDINKYRLRIKKIKEHKLDKYDSMLNNIISREEYILLAEEYKNQEIELKNKINVLESKILKNNKNKTVKKLEQVKIQNLLKGIVEALISKIAIYDRDKIDVEFAFCDNSDGGVKD